jgi:hypothetical protein
VPEAAQPKRRCRRDSLRASRIVGAHVREAIEKRGKMRPRGTFWIADLDVSFRDPSD